MDLGGRIPQSLANLALPTLMGVPYRLQVYFLKIHPSGSCTQEDGAHLGHHLMDAVEAAKRGQQANAVHEFVSQSTMLQDARIAHIDTLLTKILERRFHNPRAVAQAEPALLSEADAQAIGESVKAIRLGHNKPSQAVDELLRNYEALRIAAENTPWFRAMLEAVLKRQMKGSTSMRVRLVLGVLLSYFDVGSDIFSIYSNFALGDASTAWSLTAMVGLCLTFQSALMYYRHRHLGGAAVAKEIALLFTFLKPVLELSRLSAGHEVDGARFNANTERSYTSGIEMVTESLPSACFQSAVVVVTGQLTWATVVSICFSWLSTAYKSYSIAFNQARRCSDSAMIYGFTHQHVTGRQPHRKAARCGQCSPVKLYQQSRSALRRASAP